MQVSSEFPAGSIEMKIDNIHITGILRDSRCRGEETQARSELSTAGHQQWTALFSW